MIVKILFITILLFKLIVNIQALAKIITAWNTTVAVGYNNYTADITGISYNDTYVYVTCNSIPAYTIGPWSNNPNTALPQNYTYKFYLTASAAKNNRAVSLGAVGLWKDGVAIYNANDGNSYNNSGVWYRNAFYWESVSFDGCKGHPDGKSIYHNHVNVICTGGYNYTDSSTHSPLLGFMFDSYPIYGPYGYSSANDSSSSIKRMVSGYSLRNITERSTYPNGTTTASSGPVINSTYPLGSFLYDYEWLSSNGDLDAYNGRYCVTPEFPDGTYAYFVTLDSSSSPAYPFTIGTYYYGKVAGIQNVTLPSGLTKYF